MPSDRAELNKDSAEASADDRLFRAFAPPSGEPPAAPPSGPPTVNHSWPHQAWPGWTGPPPPPGEWNGFAITSLVFGILGFACCLWAVGIGFGIAALRAIPRRNQRGKGLAVAGLALSGFWVVATVLAVVVAAVVHRVTPPAPYSPGGGAPGVGSVSVAVLEPGDCYEKVDSAAQAARVRIVSCSRSHDGEVFGTVNLLEIQFPGAERLAAEASRACAAQRSDYALDTEALPDSVEVRFFVPDETSWGETAGHQATCTFVDRSGERAGSLEQDPRMFTPEQLGYLEAVRRFHAELAAKPSGDVTAADQADDGIWARDLESSVTSELETLGSATWSDGVRQPIADLTAELRQMLPHLEAAQQATSPAAMTRELAAAESHTGERQARAVRGALGLDSGTGSAGSGTGAHPAPVTLTTRLRR